MNVKFITGSMGAGKSAQLIDDIDYYEKNAAKVRIALKKESHQGVIESRNGRSIECLVLNVEMTDFEMLALLSNYIYNLSGVDCMYVDEAQFLSAKQTVAIETAALIFNLDIRFYGLMTDFTGEIFEGSEQIMKISDSVHVIPSECESADCENDAVFNARIVDGKVITQGEQLVEAKNVYKSLCVKCFQRLK